MGTLVLNQVTKTFPGAPRPTISDFNLQVPTGEFIVLVGPSGCGKSTILRMIAGLTQVSSGQITLGEQDITQVHPKDRNVSMVFQNYAIFPHMTVRENISFGLRIRKIPTAEIKHRVNLAAKTLQLEALLQRKPSQLSGGQRQRVALGRAMVRDPRVFLFDEPLSNLDAKLRLAMRAEIIEFHRRLRKIMIYVTHDQLEAMTMADRIVILNDGVIQQIGTPLEVYHHPQNQFVAGFIGQVGMNFLPGKICGIVADSLHVDGSGHRFVVPAKGLRPTSHANNAQVTLGVRPEHVYFRHAADPSLKASSPISATIDLIEFLGDESIIHLRSESLLFRMKTNRISDIRVGEKTEVVVDMAKIHLFGHDGNTVTH